MKNSIRTLVILTLLTISGCVQQTHTKKITFKVDMNAVQNVSNVGLRGQFTDPPWELTVAMTDENNDGIYEVTVSDKTAKSSVAFKFLNRHDQYELKDKENRVLNFEYKPETITYEAVFDDESGKQFNTREPKK